MTTQQYIDNLNNRYKLGNATEHTFRGDLQTLLESLVPGIRATNEPKRQSCGAPDFILTKKDIPVGYIEAKDINDKDLAGLTGNKEQFNRYKASLNNLFFTDYLNFRLYRNGQFITQIAIGELTGRGIIALTQNFATFESLVKDFCSQIGQTIKSPKKLAEMMAAKARLLSDIIEKALTSDETNQEDSTLKDQMNAFKKILIHDITAKGFADVYAQTISYGMFAARLHDPTLPTFSRQEAAELIPKSNPFLRKLFGYIAGPDIDDRIKWVVDSLVEIFLACNVEEILKDYGNSTKTEDPIIHFYETFLSEYDPKLRKARGVWYTPAPVVNFIVRAVDDILKSEFNLPQGLADNSKTKIKVNLQATDKRYTNNVRTIEEEVHRVQILDPATGTGTFLAEVVKLIHKKFEGQQGIWSKYVDTNLLPRLNGFELLMASYAMAHLQLDLLLTETGYKPSTNQRFRVYLTNSLEESHPDTGTLFANWLSTEANEANHIKRDTPVMCVIGNPPYSGISSNNGKWISNLIEDYKYIDGVHINERKHWLNDDYVKFIRYGQSYIEKNGSGVLAFINPHGFLDNPTFRGMRWNLLKTYDKIYTIDLHGNAKKKETAKDGSVDVNVFDIQQGVSINIFIKTGKKRSNQLGKVFHFDVYGSREMKYNFLLENTINNIKFKKLLPEKPFLLFVDRSNDGLKEYEQAFKLPELFSLNSVGMVSARDKFCIDDDLKKLKTRINEFANNANSDADIIRTYGLKDTSTFKLGKSRNNLFNESSKDKFYKRVTYRPFDNKWIFYNNDVVERPITKVMQHFHNGNNLGLVIGRQGQVVGSMPWNLVFITNSMTDFNLFYRGGGMLFPIYCYPEKKGQLSIGKTVERTPNLNTEIVKRIAENLGLPFSSEKETTKNTFAPIDILDYIYAVLHSPTYREKYKEFLKIDFPRIPYPTNQKKFWQLVALGADLRQIHLLENPIVEKKITLYQVNGDNRVTRPKYKNGKLFINDTQYFDNVPEAAWTFYIGGYQPAQKWLKDRKERTLSFDDILQYQKIIVALTETANIMSKINDIDIESKADK